MKKLYIYISLVLALLVTSCKDYLEVVDYSKVDNTFVFQSEIEAQKLVTGLYQKMQGSGPFQGDTYYCILGVGSDIELGPELITSNARYYGANLFPSAYAIPYAEKDGGIGQITSMYTTVNACNIFIQTMEATPKFIQEQAAGKPTAFTHMYAEAVTIRAIMYYELTRIYGDIPYSIIPYTSQAQAYEAEVENRCNIQEAEIANIKRVIPLMYKMGQNGVTPERLSTTAAYGVMARLAMIRGGFALRPNDEDKSEYEVTQSDDTWGYLGRRTDWKEWYKVANDALKQIRDNGGVSLVTSGNNPFQSVFQALHEYRFSTESIFEASLPRDKSGQNSEFGYAFGRPSNGSNGQFPPKVYAQIRFFPGYYWGEFDPADLRRDVTVTVSGSGGQSDEVLIPWKKANVAKGGGISANKWDLNRLSPFDANNVSVQRKSGLNAMYMRVSDMLLLLAETEAYLAKAGEAGYSTGNAIAELQKVRSRAFRSADHQDKVTGYLALRSSADEVIEAVQDERKFELGGEGQRRFDLVRWGIMGKKINELQTEQTRLINELKSNGYVQYKNGNQFPAYVWVKHFDRTLLGADKMLTGNIPEGVNQQSVLTDKEAALVPGWRGSPTAAWEAYAGNPIPLARSMAIQGLFKFIPEGSPEAVELVAAGYKKTAYGSDMISDITVEAIWTPNPNGVFGGYMPSDFAANKPPRYLSPIYLEMVRNSKGKLVNKYGYPNP